MYFKTIEWNNADNTVVMIDQRKLPNEEVYFTAHNWEEMAFAIKDMVIRGAPAIGVAGAMGLALAGLEINSTDTKSFFTQLRKIADSLIAVRPTAVNLAWGVNRVYSNVQATFEKKADIDIDALQQMMVRLSRLMKDEDITLNKQIGSHGQKLFVDGDKILTHCNAGALATAGYGTALGVIYAAWDAGKKIEVYADETRPFLQGARLTAWELHKNNIPTTLITDNMAGHLMKQGLITKVIVGADRIAANGDTANKIGTYSVAVLAKRHNIPFYVAAPLSTIDLKTRHGDEIVIEERPTLEVTHIQGVRISPEGIKIRNPAFDVTPSDLIAGIITEKGIVAGDFESGIKKLF